MFLRKFPSKAYELYRKSDLGMSLTEVICQLVDKGFIAESAGYDILRQFDYSVIKVNSYLNVNVQSYTGYKIML